MGADYSGAVTSTVSSTSSPLATLTRTRAELAAALDGDVAPRAVVMTMGALHQGHFDLVAEAARRVGPSGTVVVTIFLNPLQFAPGEDLDAYPRTLDADVAGITAALTDEAGAPRVGRLIVFAPTPQVMYPAGEPTVRLDPGPMATVLEGATRPTHFAGVLQVVLTLMHLTRPRWALFGRKDAQQLAIVSVDIRREEDGLAMSSRNAYLSATERGQALALSRALEAGRQAAASGADAAGVRQVAAELLAGAEGVEVDYVAVVDPDSFVERAGAGLGLPAADDAAAVATTGTVLLALAAKVGSTRLIASARANRLAGRQRRRGGARRRRPSLRGAGVRHACCHLAHLAAWQGTARHTLGRDEHSHPDDDDVQDSPRHRHPGRPQLRRLDHGGRCAAGGR